MSERTTMKDIADALGLSINAVSLAINNRAGVSDKTRDAVIRTAYGMGYFETNRQALRKIKLKNICILCKNKVLTDVHFYNVVFKAMQTATKRAGYDLIIESTETLSDTPSCIVEHKVSGAVIIGTFPDDAVLRVRDAGVPLVLVNHEILEGNVDSIVNKNFQGAALAVRHLYEHGHRRIGFAGHTECASSLAMRKAGFRHAAMELGIYGDRFDELYRTYSFESDITPYITVHDFPGIAKRLREKYAARDMPTALFCENDAMAIGLVRAFDLIGVRVPDDLSMVSFDNIDTASIFSPALTTIDVPIRALGERAIDRLLWRMEHPHHPYETIALEMKLIARDTVRRLLEPAANDNTR